MDLFDFQSAPSVGRRELVSSTDPRHYVRAADVALLYGTRDEAIALIERAYLAFDLAAADCDEFMGLDTAWLGKNN